MEKLEFRKVRDFGELLNDTFIFVKLTWKPLLKVFFSICGFFIAATIVMSVLYQVKLLEAIAPPDINVGERPFNSTFWMLSKLFNTEFFLLMLFSMLEYISIPLTVICFVSLYQQNGGQAPTTADVWVYFKFYFLRYSVSSIILMLFQMVGFVFCFLPGIYLMPIVSLMLAVMVFENASLGYSFRAGFRLISGHWWETFGALLMTTIVAYALMLAFSLPGVAVSMGSIFTGSPKTAVSTFQLIVNSVKHIGMVFWILPYITVCLVYFSLTEKKDGIGLENRINQFGTDQKPNLPAEEY